MRSAPRDKPGETGDVVLERTTGQTLWWVLGHPVRIAAVAASFTGVVIVASAIAAGSAPATIDGTATPSNVSESNGATGVTEATIVLSCPSGTYTARANATVRVDRVSWHSTAGACRG